MEKVKVQCLSDVVGLQQACQQASVRFSTETNKFLVYDTLQKLGPSSAQKLVSKLVDEGVIQWAEDEDFEVEHILDHADEDDKRYYLIKWEGWNQFHNSWEPAENLHCPGVVSDYLDSVERHLPVKRAVPKMSESAQVIKRRKVDEIFHKLWRSPISQDMTPLQLLTMHRGYGGGGLSGTATQVLHKGLVSSHDRNMRPKFSAPAPNYTSTKKKGYKLKKVDVLAALKDWERKLNRINTDPAPILIENDVDLEGPPENFQYINDYRAGEGIEIPQDPIIGCECVSCFDEKKSCCGAACGSEFAYYKGKKVRVPRGTPIYECNKRCKCGPDCPNRVVQFGRNCKVCIFRTANSRGWGVKTMQKIKKGTFVMEYVGEVITNEEAERRGKIYDAECRTYLFDLDYNDGDCPFTVDAGYYGNVSHFVNHSCEPNLVVFGVWINTLDPRLPRICLFADRDIQKGEELTFDYMMTGDTTQPQQNLGFTHQMSPAMAAPDLTPMDRGIELPTADGLSQGKKDLPPTPMSETSSKTPPSSPLKGSKTPPSSPSKGSKTPPASPSKGNKTPPCSPSKGSYRLSSPLKLGNILSSSTFKAEISGQELASPVSSLSEGLLSTASSPSKLQRPPILSAAVITAQEPAPEGSGVSEKVQEADLLNEKKVEKTPVSAKKKYRMICQCGAAKCRKYLF